jgi:hypothetical protein
MARSTFITLARSALQLIMGLSDPKIARPLAPHGLTEGTLEDGWARLRAVTRARRAPATSSERSRLVKEIDTMENHWFPIVRYVLHARFPGSARALFDGLRQSSGRDVILSADLFVVRLEEMAAGAEPFGAEGPAARQALADRGLTDDVLDTLRALLARVASLGDVEESAPDAATRARAVASLEAWYREWAGIARVVVTNRAHLRMLGLRNGRRAATPIQDEPGAQAVAPIEAPEPRAALPAQAGDAAAQPSAQLPGVCPLVRRREPARVGRVASRHPLAAPPPGVRGLPRRAS